MTYFAVNAGMTLAALCLGIGYALRGDTARHRRWMIAGVSLVALSAVVLLVVVYGFHGGDAAAAGFHPSVPPPAILAHRILAGVTFLLMLAMLFTGLRRLRRWHIALHRVFTPLFILVYCSGLLFFSNERQ